MNKILTFPSVVISFVIEKGFLYSILFGICYIYLKFCKFFSKSRFDLYNFYALEDPEKNGFFIPKGEKYLEYPKKTSILTEFSDNVFIFGSNSKFECLAINIMRIQDTRVKCSLALRLQNGKFYSLPEEHIIEQSTSDNDTFGSARLKVQCITPMRKWKIFFNGLLRENSEDSSFSEYKHVKFSFLWVASSNAFDFLNDMSILSLSHNVASSVSWNSMSSFNDLFKAFFNRYEQAGMLLGTLQVEDDTEKEIYLWGCRGKSITNKKTIYLKNSHLMTVCGNFQDGSLIHIAFLNPCCGIKGFYYGYVMKSTGFIYPIEKIDSNSLIISEDTLKIDCYADDQRYKIVADMGKIEVTNFRKEFNLISTVQTAKFLKNGEEGKGFVFKGQISNSETKTMKPKQNPTNENVKLKSPYMTVSFDLNECQFLNLCGGKGSSLGKLLVLSEIWNNTSKDNKFEVPKGIVVTALAYQEFTENELKQHLNDFEKSMWCETVIKRKIQLCERVIEKVKRTKVPEIIKSSVIAQLENLFGSSFEEKQFAIRSSGIGEDTEQMSAAGQNETFLGVRGIKEIMKAIVKCWASQFSFQAVEYKRQYGQLLNMPMAVVIQEMVACDIAGVLFTCDPISGNPTYINITANWGLGESVVSAAAEPDTIIIKRCMNNFLSLSSKAVGKKECKIITDDDIGTRKVEIGENCSECCLSDEKALKLGEIAVMIEKEYESPRDIEWGIYNGKIYLFQCRPITSLDVENNFEIEHCIDSALRCESEMSTRAHVGEALQGAGSVLGFDFMNKLNTISNEGRLIRFDGNNYPDKPYFFKGFNVAYFTVFFDLIGGIYSKIEDSENNFTNAMIVSFFGRLIDDKEIRKMAKKRHTSKKNVFSKVFTSIVMLSYTTFILFFSSILFRRIKKRKEAFKVPFEKSKSASETLGLIASHYGQLAETMNGHVDCSFSSSIWNSTLLSLLAKSEGDWNNIIYSDFAYLLSTCSEVESANIPTSIQELSYIISKNIDPEHFKKISTEEALDWLRNSNNEATEKFKAFLERHGQRCVREADVYSQVFEDNLPPLIKTLQNLTSKNAKSLLKRESDDFPTILSNIKVKLNFFEKLKLRFLLSSARTAVGKREISKAFFVKQIHCIRKAFRFMATQMVKEGRLPMEDYLFFLNLHELSELSVTRSPKLVSKAARRYKCYEKMNKLMFDEIICGIPKPMNEQEQIPTTKGFKMTGVPVSRGIVKARACVAKNIEEASNIQQGDILITYSTDTAWSPYFPLLAGVVTELGGLISHGAVVAREYGLPCVVALHGATRAFKSGDVVILDGDKGILQKLN